MSEEVKHTPGPWRVDTTNAFGAYGVWTDYSTHPGHDGAGYGLQVCSVLTVSFKQTDRETRPERGANARLIAAAPELVAACEAMIEAVDGSHAQVMFAIGVMKRVVAKAKGTVPV